MHQNEAKLSSAAKKSEIAKFSVLQPNTAKCIRMVQNRLVQYKQRGAVQWKWMQLRIVHRRASHCPKLVNWAKLGPDKILDSDFFAFI